MVAVVTSWLCFGNSLTHDPKNPKTILAAGSIIQDHSDMDVALVKSASMSSLGGIAASAYAMLEILTSPRHFVMSDVYHILELIVLYDVVRSLQMNCGSFR